MWEKWGLADPLSRFFTELWAELFDERTPDTWQVRTCNTRTILEEIVDAVEVSKQHHERYAQNIPFLVKELLRVAQLDPVVLRHCPTFLDDARPMIEGGSARVDQTARRAMVLLDRLRGYQKWLTDRISDSLASNDQKPKEQLNRLALAYGTELSAVGYSTPYLGSLALSLATGPKVAIAERFAQLRERVSGQRDHFTCTVPVDWTGALSRPSIQFGRVRIFRGRPETPPESDARRFYESVGVDETFAEVIVEAHDAISAQRIAFRALSDLFASARLFQFSKSPAIKGDSSLVVALSGSGICGPDVSRRRHLKDAARGFNQSLERMEALLKRLRVHDREHLVAALQYHRLALEAPNDESRLVNMWVALECLVRKGASESTIDNVAAAVSHSVAVGNPRKHLRNISYYVINSCRDRDKLRTLFEGRTFPGSNPVDVLKVLTDVRDGKLINGLFECVQSPLVRYRIHRLRHSVFNSAASIADNIEGHQQNVEWQVRRIYRARNQVIHRGRSSAMIRHLTQHLHTYFVAFTNNLIYDMTNHAGFGIDEAITFRDVTYAALVRQLRNHDGGAISRRMLIEPDAVYGPADADTIAWPSPEASRNESNSDGPMAGD
jgi:hypothetical protein